MEYPQEAAGPAQDALVQQPVATDVIEYTMEATQDGGCGSVVAPSVMLQVQSEPHPCG